MNTGILWAVKDYINDLNITQLSIWLPDNVCILVITLAAAAAKELIFLWFSCPPDKATGNLGFLKLFCYVKCMPYNPPTKPHMLQTHAIQDLAIFTLLNTAYKFYQDRKKDVFAFLKPALS